MPNLDAVPEANRPGHHPDHEQDKPTGPPPTPARAEAASTAGQSAGKAGKAGKAGTGKSAGKSGTAGTAGTGEAATVAEPRDTATAEADEPNDEASEKPAADGTPPPAPGPVHQFAFAFEPAQLLAGLPFGVTPLTTGVTVDGERLHVRYGPWSLTTPLANVAGTTETGPFQLLKIAGPAHLSFADRGVAFCTRRDGGLCIRFHEPVRAIAPIGPLLHPAATVTVTDRDGLRRLLDAAASEAA